MIDAMELHHFARKYADLRRSNGANFDKKLLRFNDIVDVGIFYARCSTHGDIDVAHAGIRDAIDACVIDDPMYVRRSGPAAMLTSFAWMVAA